MPQGRRERRKEGGKELRDSEEWREEVREVRGGRKPNKMKSKRK